MKQDDSMKQRIQHIIAPLLALNLFLLAPAAQAQEVPPVPEVAPVVEVVATPIETSAPIETVEVSDTPTEAVESIIVESIESDLVEVVTTLQNTEDAVQEATSAQSAVVSDVIEATVNPEQIETAEAVATELLESQSSVPVPNELILVEETALSVETPLEGATESSVEAALEDIAGTDITEEVSPSPVLSSEVIDAPLAMLVPEPVYAFEVTGKQIPTTRQIKNKEGVVIGEDIVTNTLVPQVDNAKGEVYVSGQCADAYYVVLLFKNSTDYLDDPRSYIFNSAYPCVGGVFSYSISTLPNNLPNGTYYILIGQQGSKGAWKPITSLTEITINRTQ